MQSFSHLPEQDRWALAFYTGTFAYPSQLVAKGQRVWESDASLRQKIPDLKSLVGVTPQALAKAIGEQKAAAVIAYLATWWAVRLFHSRRLARLAARLTDMEDMEASREPLHKSLHPGA